MGGDPHFSIVLADNKRLCYTVQGEHGSVFNLISNKNFHMNALFVPNSGVRNATWIGSLGVVMWNGRSNVTKLKFDAASKEIHLGDGITLAAKSVRDFRLHSGELYISIVSTKKQRANPTVKVNLEDVGLNFTVRFTQKHLEMSWTSIGRHSNDLHGLIGKHTYYC